MGILGKYLLDFKIKRRIHSRYKKLFPGSRIASLLPPEVEQKIKTGTVIEESVIISNKIESLGSYIYIGKRTEVMSCSSIGSFTSISADVKIGLMSHPVDYISTSPVFYAKRRGWVNENTYDELDGKKTIISSDVLISANALIKNGVTLGVGCIVGAGAFVNDDVPPYAIVAGVPAKIIRYRFEQHMIEKLLASEWWTKSEDAIKKAGHFNDPKKFLESLAQS